MKLDSADLASREIGFETGREEKWEVLVVEGIQGKDYYVPLFCARAKGRMDDR